MPPKGSRGGGRGRGRGRGKATASSAAEQAPDIPMTGTDVKPEIQSTLEASSPPLPAPEPPTAKITTPQNVVEDDSAPSPNSSPATVPTETPAPTPVRAPLQRIESTGSGSIPPPTRGGRGGVRGGRGKNAAESKFKPMNRRRDAGELQELAQKEQARLAGIAQDRAREEARASRGRGRPPRGRGDVMGRGAGTGKATATASGVFSVAPEALALNPGFVRVKSGGGGGDGGSRSAPASGSTVKKESGPYSGGGGGGGGGGGSGGRSGQTVIPEPEYPDEDGDAPRVDIEHINLVSDSEGDKTSDDLIVTGSRRVSKPHQANKYGLKPIRLHREEHKDRVSQVNTEPAVKPAPDSDSEDLPTIDELRSTGIRHDRKDSKGLHRDLAEEIRVKAEPGVELSLRESTVEPSVPPSPESRRKAKAQILASSSAIDVDSEHEDNASPTVRKERKARRHSKKQDKKPVLQTEEDKAEWERHLEDMDVLAKELGGLQGNLSLRSQDADGDFTMGDGPKEKDPGRIYLFQFPPVLPELYNPLTSAKPKPKGSVKAEKEDEKDKEKGKGKGKDKDVDMTGLSAGAKAKGKGKQTADLTETAVKIEEDAILADAADAAVKHPPEGARKKKDEFVHEEGWIGKLIVRESGRVELNWGGTHLLVGRGAEAGFLSNALVVDGIERGPPGGGAPEGKATSMGQVMGKFVVTPDWEKTT